MARPDFLASLDEEDLEPDEYARASFESLVLSLQDTVFRIAQKLDRLDALVLPEVR